MLVLLSLKEGEVFKSMGNITFGARPGVAGSAVGEGHLWAPREHLCSLWKDIWVRGPQQELGHTQRGPPDSAVFPSLS